MRVCIVVFATNVCNYFELRKNHAKKKVLRLFRPPPTPSKGG